MLNTVEEVDKWFERMVKPHEELAFWMGGRMTEVLVPMVKQLDAILFSMDEREHLALIDYFISRCYNCQLHTSTGLRIKEIIEPLTSDRVFPVYINLFVKKYTFTQDK